MFLRNGAAELQVCKRYTPCGSTLTLTWPSLFSKHQDVSRADSSVDIAARYVLDSPGIECR